MLVDLNDKNVLVTGGCGFIGSNFIHYLFNNYSNVKVTNIDKFGIGAKELIDLYNNRNYNEYIYDLAETEYFCLETCFLKPFDYVFHFAAESHVDRSINSPEEFIENNVMAIVRLFELLRKYSPKAKIINVSTDEVYGQLQNTLYYFNEECNLEPRSPYSASKASCDLFADAYNKTYGLNVITTRCCNNFGPGQFYEKFIPKIIRNAYRRELIPIYGKGKNIREWIHVEDHVKSLLEIATFFDDDHLYQRVYNIGGVVELSNIDMVWKILNIMKSMDVIIAEEPIEFVEDRKGHDFRYALDSLHYTRSFSLQDFDSSLEKTIESYLLDF